MKKYRYHDPGQITPFQRYRAYAVLFIGWNVCGYYIYKFLSENAAKRDPDWEKRPQDERIALMTGADLSAVKRFDLSSLFGSKEEEKKEP